MCGSSDHWRRECPKKVNNVNNVYYDWHGNEVGADTIFQNQQSQQLQSQSLQQVHQGQSSSSSTQAPSTSNSSTTYRSSAGGSTVGRLYIWDLTKILFQLLERLLMMEQRTILLKEWIFSMSGLKEGTRWIQICVA